MSTLTLQWEREAKAKAEAAKKKTTKKTEAENVSNPTE